MKPILFITENIYEDLELFYPKLRLEEAGFKTIIAGPEKDTIYTGKHGYPCKSEMRISDCFEKDFSALIIPGGFAPDKLRRSKKVLDLTKDFYTKGKLVGFICHAGWVPISAKILNGKKVTGTVAIKDDLENAGATYIDEAVVIDHNLISARVVSDLPLFGKALVEFLSKQ